MKKKSFKTDLPMWALLTIPVLWLAAAAAFAYEDGMTVFDWMEAFSPGDGVALICPLERRTRRDFCWALWRSTPSPSPSTTQGR